MVPLLAAVLAASAAEVAVESGPRQTVMVELYTSEGCSSCPPADRWLSQLRRRPGLWRDFVPVGFHVNYWDHLGWPDPLASAAFAARQRRYAAAWGSKRVYTPGLVVAGEEARDWDVPRGLGKRVGVLKGVLTPERRVVVTWTPGRVDKGEWTAHAALLGFDIESRVRAGENRGRTLSHDFSVLAAAAAPLQKRGEDLARTLTLPPPSARAKRYGLAVWVAPTGGVKPVQAAGGYLSAEARKLIESRDDRKSRGR